MAAISQACSPVRWGESTKDGLDAVQEKVHLGLREFSGAVRENPLVERHDSGDVRNRVSWRVSDSCWQAGIARSVGPADVGRHWNANHSRDPASIESVTLNDHDRSPESRTGSRTAAASQPTRPRPAQSPLGLLQNPTARGPDEFIGIRIHFGAHSTQRFGHFVRAHDTRHSGQALPHRHGCGTDFLDAPAAQLSRTGRPESIRQLSHL